MVQAQVSVYPIETNDADAVINSSINALAEEDVDYTVGPISTQLRGNADQVFAALQELFTRACQGGGEVSLVATVTNSDR